jgi:hypothetical protein
LLWRRRLGLNHALGFGRGLDGGWSKQRHLDALLRCGHEALLHVAVDDNQYHRRVHKHRSGNSQQATTTTIHRRRLPIAHDGNML